MNAAFVLIGSGCLVCLLPLALYLLFLAYLNNRRQPTLVAGTWDVACLLLGLSGFFLVGGPVLLSAFDSAWRAYVFEGNLGLLRTLWKSDGGAWSILVVAYVAGLAVGVMLLFRARRRVSVVYNFPPVDPETVVAGALDRLGLRWRKQNGVFEIGPGGHAAGLPKAPGAPLADPERADTETSSPPGGSQLVVDLFPTMRHATLRWTDPVPLVRRAVELELAKSFGQTFAPANPAGGWFLTASVSLFFVMLLWMAFLILFMFRTPAVP